MNSRLVKTAFIVSIVWWIYLFFTTQIVMVFDSPVYEELGSMLAHQGWVEYLRTGPNREPLFPWLVSISMHLGDWWKVSYYYPLKMFGTLFLFLTVYFSEALMQELSIRPWIRALTVLYMGFSPVLTNSSMRMWSEFGAYPWVVLAVFWSVKSWKVLISDKDERVKKAVGLGSMVALMFLLVMFDKAVAEGVLLLYLAPFYALAIAHWLGRRPGKAKQAIVFCLTVLFIFEGVVNIYRWGNLHYNGNFAFTDRGDSAVWANTARRLQQPLTPKGLGAAVTFIPGLGICEKLFGQDECEYWSARHSDDIMAAKRKELTDQGLSDKEVSHYFVGNTVKMILSNPMQAVLLMAVEAHKMFLWESSIAFVAYPDWLERIFYSPLVTVGLKFVMAALTWIACAFAFGFLAFRRLRNRTPAPEEHALLWVVNFIFWFMTMYSLFFILDRYAFPLISLYMVLIAFLLDRISRIFWR